MNPKDKISETIAKTIGEYIMPGGSCDEASEAIISALPECVPDLIWEEINEYTTIERAKSSVGYYTATQDEDSAAGRVFLEFHLTENGDCMMGAIEVKHDCFDEEDWREAANTHHRATIMKGLGL